MISSEKPDPLLPHGGYRKLRSYKVAEAVYDATVVFCRRFFAQDRRMTDQMVLARHYGFTAEELDFILNYDIKYRHGRDTGEEE